MQRLRENACAVRFLSTFASCQAARSVDRKVMKPVIISILLPWPQKQARGFLPSPLNYQACRDPPVHGFWSSADAGLSPEVRSAICKYPS